MTDNKVKYGPRKHTSATRIHIKSDDDNIWQEAF